MELKKENEKLKKPKETEKSGMEMDTLIEKIRLVVDDFNEIASYFQKSKLSGLGDDDELETNFQSPGSINKNKFNEKAKNRWN
jgi:hypothetical protein